MPQQAGFQVPSADLSITATVEQLRSGGTYLYWIHIFNDDPAPRWLQLFDAAAPSDVTLGTTAPTLTLMVLADGGYDTPWTVPMKFELGVQYAATTTSNGLTAPTTALLANFGLR